jgi:hypothetical protein
MFSQYYYAMRGAMAERLTSSCAGASSFHGNWQAIGPNALPGIQQTGRVDVVWSSPTDTNYILAGTPGGLFKTIDGGVHWYCITDNAPLVGGLMGVYSIAVNQFNENEIYLGTVADGVSTNGGAAILESFDGGATWKQEFINGPGIMPEGLFYDTIESVQGVYLSPDTTRLYAMSDHQIFTRSNVGAGNVWQNITPSGNREKVLWKNMKFVPGSSTHFFVSNTSGVDRHYQGIYESTTGVPDTATGWTRITAGFTGYVGGLAIHDSEWSMMNIDIPDPDTLFFSALAYTRQSSIYKYCISNHQFYLVYNNLPNIGPDYCQGKGEIAVSAAGTSMNGGRRNIYFGWDQPYHSFDGGNSPLVQASAWSPLDSSVRLIASLHNSFPTGPSVRLVPS